MTVVNSERKAEAEGSPIVSRRSIGDESCMLTLPFLDSHPLLISHMLCMVQVAWIGPAALGPLLQAGQSPQGTLLEHQPGALLFGDCNLEGPVSHPSHHTQIAPDWGPCTQQTALTPSLETADPTVPRRDLPSSPWFLRWVSHTFFHVPLRSGFYSVNESPLEVRPSSCRFRESSLLEC